MNFIDLIVIGSAKAGTSTIHTLLESHPSVCMSRPKETMFFADETQFVKGREWYHDRYFKNYKGQPLLGESTPAYSDRDNHPGVPERVKSANPASKLIFCIRHPLRKVESTWAMLTNVEQTSCTNDWLSHLRCKALEGFPSFIADESINRYLVSLCSYAYQLDAWHEHFLPQQLHVVFLEDLAKNYLLEVAKICTFIGVDKQPLITQKPNVRNSLRSRRSLRSFVPSLVRLGLHQVLPRNARAYLRTTPLFSSPPKPELLQPEWPPELRSLFVSHICDDIKRFLQIQGKPDDFYVF
jgi:hypothetical protein